MDIEYDSTCSEDIVRKKETISNNTADNKSLVLGIVTFMMILLIVISLDGKSKVGNLPQGEYAIAEETQNTVPSEITPAVVKEVQFILNQQGYNCGKADGIIGRKTKDAIKAFQKNNGLKVDGVIGQQTIEKLWELMILPQYTGQ